MIIVFLNGSVVLSFRESLSSTVSMMLVISLLLCPFLLQSQASDKAYVASVPTRHSLPNNRIIAMFGSLSDGNCSLPVPSDHRGGICNGTSVLNDGIIPALNVGDDSESLWAAQLLTMKRGSNGPIVLSFEVENQFYDCVELAVFNCPEKNMNASGFSIYQDSSFRPERQEASLGDNIIANHSLSNSSCDYLLRFYVSFMSEVNSSYFNIRFPNYTTIENIGYVFVGEVSFLTGAHDCEKWPPELIETTKYSKPPELTNVTEFTLTSESINGTENDYSSSNPPSTSSTVQNSQTILIIAVATMVVISLIILVVVVFMIVFVFLRNHKREKVLLKMDDTRCLEDSMTQTNQEFETKFNDSVHKASSVNSERLKESMSASSIPVLESDGIYSNADEVENVVSASCTGMKSSNQASGQQYYVKQNPSYEADITTLNTRLSLSLAPVLSKEVDDLEGVTYAVPNKEKCKTRLSSASNLLSRAEFQASTEASLQNISNHDNDNNSMLYESVDRVPPILPSDVDGSNNNLLDYDTTDSGTDQPSATTSDIKQPSHSEEGILDTDAIYAEPLDPSSTEKVELDPDQNIYESIYSEPLKPSLFMQETPTECQEEEVESEDLYPYSSIYTVPDTDLTNKPLLVSAENIKIIKHLGKGNFGEVVLAQTVDLTPQQLQIESQAPFALVAVKRLKANASEVTKELFEKEVKFMSRLNHPNVVRMLGVCTDEENPFIMMEYMKNGDLYQYLKEFNQIGEGEYINIKSISVSTLTNVSIQIASAMQYLASHNFVHRDLATRNCLVGSKNTVKISDFGMSRSLYESHYYIISGHAILPIRWMATECFYGRFSAKTDVWAFGVTMWEIFTLAKEQPYDHLQDMELVEDAIKGPSRTLLKRPAKCPLEVYDVMKACWVHDPAQRPTFDELYEMLFKEC